MRWVTCCERSDTPLAIDVFSSALSDTILAVEGDERVALTRLATNIMEMLGTEPIKNVGSESVFFFCGPSVVNCLTTTNNPLRAVLSHFSSRQRLLEGSGNKLAQTSNMMLAITGYKGGSLREGVAFAPKIAEGLGMKPVDTSFTTPLTQYDRNIKLTFGERRGCGNHIEIKSLVEADAILRALFGSISFQRQLPGMSLHVRATFATWSDYSNDGDDSPHWINDQIVSLWFVNERHMPEFLAASEIALNNTPQLKFRNGYARCPNMEEIAKGAEIAAKLWYAVVGSGSETIISNIGRHVNVSSVMESSVMSPKTRKLCLVNEYVVQTRKRLLEETSQFLKSRDTEHHMSLAEKRAELEMLGKMHDKVEERFYELARKLDEERLNYKNTEMELQNLTEEGAIMKETIKECENGRKDLLSQIVTLSKKRDETAAVIHDQRLTHARLINERDSKTAEMRSSLVAEMTQHTEAFEHEQNMLTLEKKKKITDAQSLIQEIIGPIESMKNQNTRQETILEENIQEKRNEVETLKRRAARMKIDLADAIKQVNSTHGKAEMITAQIDQILRDVGSVDNLEQSILSLRGNITEQEQKAENLQRRFVNYRHLKNMFAEQTIVQQGEIAKKIDEKRESIINLRHKALMYFNSNCNLCVETELFSRSTLRIQEEKEFAVVLFKDRRFREQVKFLSKINHIDDYRRTLQNRIDEIQNIISEKSYKSMQLDNEILSARRDLDKERCRREEIKRDLLNNLSELQAERIKLIEATGGGGNCTFPLLNAQQEQFEEKLKVLRTCMAHPVAVPHPATVTDNQEYYGMSSFINSLKIGTVVGSYARGGELRPAEARLTTSRLVAKDADNLEARLENLVKEIKIEIAYTEQALLSLQEKKLHIAEEATLRSSVIAELSTREVELQKQILATKEAIGRVDNDLHKAHTLHIQKVSSNAEILESERLRQEHELNEIQAAINDTKLKTKQVDATIIEVDYETTRLKDLLKHKQAEQQQVQELRKRVDAEEEKLISLHHSFILMMPKDIDEEEEEPEPQPLPSRTPHSLGTSPTAFDTTTDNATRV